MYGELIDVSLLQEKFNVLRNNLEHCEEYQNLLQAVEKWLLLQSFQLMSHNSLFIANLVETDEQLTQHVVGCLSFIRIIFSDFHRELIFDFFFWAFQ